MRVNDFYKVKPAGRNKHCLVIDTKNPMHTNEIVSIIHDLTLAKVDVFQVGDVNELQEVLRNAKDYNAVCVVTGTPDNYGPINLVLECPIFTAAGVRGKSFLYYPACLGEPFVPVGAVDKEYIVWNKKLKAPILYAYGVDVLVDSNRRVSGDSYAAAAVTGLYLSLGEVKKVYKRNICVVSV